MNITESAIPHNQSNTSSLAKPNGTISEDSKKSSSSPETLDKMTSDDLTALVNIIVLLIGGLRSPSGSGVGGSPFNSSSGSNFILDFPTLPTMNQSTDANSSGTNSSDENSNSGSSLKLPPLPSFNVGTTGSNGAEGDSANEASNNNGNILKTRPLPSLVNAATGSLSTAGSSRAFNSPPIPSLTGNSPQLPSISSVDSSLSTGLNTSPQSNTDTESSTTGNLLDTRPLPSLVNPATGSLSTAGSSRAFNPPSIPSLTGNSTELPLVSGSDSKPITTGLTASLQSTNTQESSVADSSTSTLGSGSSSIFNVPAVPSLLGSGATIDSLVSSLESGTSTRSSGSGSEASSSSQEQNGSSGSHWKGA